MFDLTHITDLDWFEFEQSHPGATRFLLQRGLERELASLREFAHADMLPTWQRDRLEELNAWEADALAYP